MRRFLEHPMLNKARSQMSAGVLDRREFVRLAALLGVGAGAAYAMAGMSSPAWAQAGATPFPADDPGAKTGGVLRIAMQIQKMEDPAAYSWIEASNQSRHTVEYLAITGPDNITRPMLAESWEASDDLTTWTIHVRRGVMWHNGEELTAEHVAWNVRRWLDPAIASSIVGLSTFSAMLKDTDKMDEKGKPIRKPTETAVAVVDSHTLLLNLSRSVLSVPEDFYHYPAAILHPSFKVPFSDNPIGTGPFTLAELQIDHHCTLKRVSEMKDGRPFAYWGGKVYIDEIQYYDFDIDNQLTAFASGEVDSIYDFSVEQLDFAHSVERGAVLSAESGESLCCRMQVDKEPFNDIRVRQAIVKSVDNAVIKNLVFRDTGSVGENHFVSPIHPEYFKLPMLTRDVEGAKALLAEAGFPDGLEVTITVGNTDGAWHQSICEALRDQMQDAGIILNLEIVPPSKYWEVWTDTPFGATSWAHRPLGTMGLSLAFRSGVPWNETHFASAEFDALLDAAEATLDVEERRAKMEPVERMLQEQALMVQPIWRPVYTIVAKNVHGYSAHQSRYHQLNKVWLG